MKFSVHRIGGYVRFLAAVALGLFFFELGVFAYSKTELMAIQSALTAASGTLLGFVITSAAILLALPDRPLVHNIRQTGHLRHLLVQMVATGAVLLALLVSSILATFLTDSAPRLLATVSVTLATWAALLVIAIGRKFYLVASFAAQ